MAFCPLDITAESSKNVFRPFAVTSNAIFNHFDVLIQQWLQSTSSVSSVGPIVCDQKGEGDQAVAKGAMWSGSFQAMSRGKRGYTYTNMKQYIEILEKNDFSVKMKMTSQSEVENPCQNTPKIESTVTMTVHDKGTESQVVVTFEGQTLPFYHYLPKILCFLPCFWPHLIIITVCLAVGQPCCIACTKSQGTQTATSVCLRGCDGVKSIAENGPQQQVMSNNPVMMATQMAAAGRMVQPVVVAQMAPSGAQPVVVAQAVQVPPPAVAVNAPPPAYNPDAPPPAFGDTGAANLGFCSKCGNPRSNVEDSFCSTCGNRYT